MHRAWLVPSGLIREGANTLEVIFQEGLETAEVVFIDLAVR
jgi:hypothetical protein